MTRKEKIDASCKFEDKQDEYWNKIVPYSKSFWDAYIFGYYAGVQWADENPKDGLVSIDDVCKWLNSHTDKHPDSEYLNMFFSMLSDNFRKDMEGQL